MGKLLSTLCSKFCLSRALKIALLCVLIFELGIGFYGHFHWKVKGGVETWRALEKIRAIQDSSEVKGLILGDSTAAGLEFDEPQILNLATNYWTSMAGQYFLLKRALEQGIRPKVVMLVFQDQGWMANANEVDDGFQIDHFLLRPLGSFENARHLAWHAGRFDLALRMLLYQMMPSMRYKHEIYRALSGVVFYPFEDQWIIDMRQKLQKEHIQSAVIEGAVPVSPLSRAYFKQICKLARENGFKIKMLESIYAKSKFQAEFPYRQLKYQELDRLIQRNRDVVVGFERGKFVFPDTFFGVDGIHFKDERGKKVFRLGILNSIDKEV